MQLKQLEQDVIKETDPKLLNPGKADAFNLALHKLNNGTFTNQKEDDQN